VRRVSKLGRPGFSFSTVTSTLIRFQVCQMCPVLHSALLSRQRRVATPIRKLLDLDFPRSEIVMAKVCDVCGRGPLFGNRVSHAHNVSKRRWNINLQKVHAIVNGAAKRIRVCTSCIRNGKVQKAA
jgi:large subunit ribosomal protein L28